MPFMTHADAAWLHMESPANLMMISGLMLFDRPPPPERLQELLTHRLLRHQRFLCKVEESPLSLPRWEPDPDFDLNHHLRFEEGSLSFDQLLTRVGQLMSQSLDRARPLWEFRVFPEVEGQCAILARLHHAIADGVALMRVLLSLGDLDRQGTLGGKVPGPEEEVSREGTYQKILRVANEWLQEGHDLLLHPSHAWQRLQQGVQASQALAHVLALSPDVENAFRGPIQNEKRVAVSPPLCLESIRAQSKKLGCTINDTLMASLAGGLGRSLARQQELAPDLEIRSVVPVDLSGDQGARLGNHFGMVFLSLPVGERDPRARLLKVRQHMDSIKRSAEAVVVFEVLSAVGAIPEQVEQKIIEWFGGKATAVVTNLPGPRQPLYLAGSRLESVMYWVPQSGRLGLGVSILSYNGRVRVGVASDAGLIPQPSLLVDDFLESHREILSLESL